MYTRDELTKEWSKHVEDLVIISLHDGNPQHIVQIGSRLDETTKQLVTFLQKNANIFAWSPMDMSNVESEVMVHCLNVDLAHRPVKQKKRSFFPKRQKAIAEEVDKLANAGFI